MEEQPKSKRNYIIIAACAVLVISSLIAGPRVIDAITSSTTTIKQPAPPPVVIQPQPEPEVAAEPEKTPEELLALATEELAANDAEGAASHLRDAYDRTNTHAIASVPLLLKLGEADLALGDSDGATKVYRDALAVLERTYGPLDPHVLPALTGLIVGYDNTGAFNDFLIDRYQQIARAPAVTDSSADEAAAAALISQAQERATKDSTCLCKELDAAIEQANSQYGTRSYVVALLYLKQAEVADADENIDQVDKDTLNGVMSIIEQRFSPTDVRLKPALNRLIALHDDDEEHELANSLIKRLSILDTAPKK